MRGQWPVVKIVSATPPRCEARVSVDPMYGTLPEAQCEDFATHDGPHWYSARITWGDPTSADQHSSKQEEK